MVGLSEFFLGVIVVAVVGNAAEHSTAVLVAMKNKMDLAVNIAVGSSIQIALFVAPVLVLVSFLLRALPMALVFNGFEAGPSSLAVLIADHVTATASPTGSRASSCCGLRGAGHRLLLRLDDCALLGGPLPWLVLTAVIVGFLLIDLLRLRARARPQLPRGRGVEHRLAGGFAAGLAGAAGDVGRRGGDQLHDRVPDRALAVARQPVRLHSAVLVFGTPTEHRPRLLFWGIVAALALRGAAILGGVALINRFHFVIYVLGVALLVLAYRVLRGVDENVDPERNVFVRVVRRFYPWPPTPTRRGSGSSSARTRRTSHRCSCAW